MSGRAWEKRGGFVTRFSSRIKCQRNGGTVLFYHSSKRRGILDCENCRGIMMIFHTMKIWERVIDRRLREETTIGEEQFGFMPGRGTTDAIFAARQVMGKHREMQKELHMVFVDLAKA